MSKLCRFKVIIALNFYHL